MTQVLFSSQVLIFYVDQQISCSTILPSLSERFQVCCDAVPQSTKDYLRNFHIITAHMSEYNSNLYGMKIIMYADRLLFFERTNRKFHAARTGMS
ncbi:hypothetical protein CEXT_58431 [Caerostris extrusa]|uniref:Uncharacterized protein n=1 Tax=Caerostris extrusa TaxID=172846 RepID=A0AAV4RHQ6_CAEEX|nr:hypothetical protein CEXT_58431 [Caerostris extrusa]